MGLNPVSRLLTSCLVVSSAIYNHGDFFFPEHSSPMILEKQVQLAAPAEAGYPHSLSSGAPKVPPVSPESPEPAQRG